MRGAAERAKLDKRIATINATNLNVYADNLGRWIVTQQPSRQYDRDNNRLEAARWQRNRQPHTGRAADSVDFGAEQPDVKIVVEHVASQFGKHPLLEGPEIDP